MTYTTSKGASLERAYRHWRERGALLEMQTAVETDVPVAIAISREHGAGGVAIASALADRLDWPLYDRQLIEKIAEDTGVQHRLLVELDERKPNWFAECTAIFSQEKQISGAGYAVRLKKILMALYCHGNFIVLGRGGAQVLPSERSLSVRLIAPLSDRVDRIAAELNVTPQDAERIIAEVDDGRKKFVRLYFHKDIADASNYDLVINTAKVGDATCTDVIMAVLASIQHSGRCRT